MDSYRPLGHSEPSLELQSSLSTIATPLNLQAWRMALSDHPDRLFVSYILSGIENGFRVGFNRDQPLHSACKNCPSADAHPEVITEYISEEAAAGCFLGPIPDDQAQFVHISKFGVIPKGHTPGKWRLITDLSSPGGFSVNDGISPTMCSLSYITVDQVAAVAASLGVGSLLAKIDIQSAYRIVPVHPQDRPLLGVRWRGSVYVDAMLPFGLRSAPKIFTALADSLQWILQRRGVTFVWHYIDDFIVCGPPTSPECHRSLQIMTSTCEELGVPLAKHKVAGPTSCLTVLGIEIDTKAGQLRLPGDKLQRLKALLVSWQIRKQCSRRELESLVGLLNHACKVVRPGRSFLRRMIDLLHKADRGMAPRPHHHIRLNESFRSDLRWWLVFCSQWNGVSCWFPPTVAHQVVLSDASGAWGCGAYWHPSWFQLRWSSRSHHLPIAVKELLPIIVAAATWGPLWEGQCIQCRCDNLAVVHDIHSRSSRHGHMMHLLRCLFFFEAFYKFSLTCVHIPGKSNELADDLSRDRFHSFYSKVPGVSTDPTPVSQTLIDVLVDPRIDWLSQTWMQLFTSIVNRD